MSLRRPLPPNRPRRITPQDDPGQLAALIRRAFAGTEGLPSGPSPAAGIDAAGVTARLSAGPGFVIDGPDGPLGCVFTRASRDWPGHWYLGTLAVAEEARGRGLARRLEGAAEAEARRRGLTALALDTWEGAAGPAPLFTRWGYRTTAREGGVIAMCRDLEQPRQLRPGDDGFDGILPLLHRTFAFMEGRIDPPTSLQALTEESVQRHGTEQEIWAIGPGPEAVIFLTRQPDALYLGKLGVEESHLGRGLARALIDLAEVRARAQGFDRLRLQVRVELTENQATFLAMGFHETERTTHRGYPNPTSITYERPVPPA